MIIENHHFSKKDFYFPKWEVEHLFIGTFNPSGGETVPYYYGRKRNRFWKLLSQVLNIELDPNTDTFFENIKKYKIGCIDLIHSVKFEEKYKDFILGKGYKDSVLFKKDIEKTYNTSEILKFISKYNLTQIYFTNSGSSLNKEQKLELKKINDVCKVVYLCSPSPVNPNRGQCLEDYLNKIKL